MTVNQNSNPQAEDSSAEAKTRPGGLKDLVIPWGNIPWWGLIILIVGVLVSYSMLTNVKYLEAISFILDLPWHRRALESESIAENGEWALTSKTALEPGKYRFYVEFWDENEGVIARTENYQLVVVEGAGEQELDPIPLPNESSLTSETTRPTFTGTDAQGVTAVLYDDFSHRPLRVMNRMWNSDGLFLTLRVTLLAFSSALVLGLVFGLMRVADRAPDLRDNMVIRALVGAVFIVLLLMISPGLRKGVSLPILIIVIEGAMILLPAVPYTLSTLYVEIMRGLPMLVIVLYMGFAITPALRDASESWVTGEVDLRGLPAAIIGLALGYGAYLAEIFRGGIESIPRGQMEAARSLGMNYFQAMRNVILPQAIRVIMPPLGNNFIAMLKDSSLISVIALPELLQRGRLWISRTFRAFEGYNSVAILYLLMTLILSVLVRVIERRTSID